MNTACLDALSAASTALGLENGKAAAELVRGMSVSGQQHGLVALDADFEVIRPAKLWCDTESAPEAAELAELFGWGVVSSFTCSKLLWLKRHEPDSFARLAHVALPHDYLNYVLSGDLVMECGDASGTGLLDTVARTWDAKAAALVDEGLLPKLPSLIKPTELAGTLQPSAAERLGLPSGLPIAAGGGDNMMSALGCGCSVEGRAAISLGTSGVIFAKTPAAASDPTGAVCPFLDSTGGGLPLLCTLNCASVPEEVREGYGLGRDEISALAEAEPIGSEGVSLLPYLIGERTPNWPHASGGLVGLRPGHLARPGLLYRAALEGIAFSLRDGLDAMRKHGLPEGCNEVRLVGGGSKSSLWRQIIADALQMRVACPSEPESAALGAALQAAAVVAGVDDIGAWIDTEHPAPVGEAVDPNPAVAAEYEAAFALYAQRGKALFAEK
jgi:xylulokinase